MLATLVGLFGSVTLLLAIVGLYGVMAQMTTERTAEIGIRLAIGANPASVVALLMRRGLRLLAIGNAIGVAFAFVSTRYVESQLFGITPTDPATFIGVCVVLTSAGVAACAIRPGAHCVSIRSLRCGAANRVPGRPGSLSSAVTSTRSRPSSPVALRRPSHTAYRVGHLLQYRLGFTPEFASSDLAKVAELADAPA
jgi:hypothetical protein